MSSSAFFFPFYKKRCTYDHIDHVIQFGRQHERPRGYDRGEGERHDQTRLELLLQHTPQGKICVV